MFDERGGADPFQGLLGNEGPDVVSVVLGVLSIGEEDEAVVFALVADVSGVLGKASEEGGKSGLVRVPGEGSKSRKIIRKMFDSSCRVSDGRGEADVPVLDLLGNVVEAEERW